MTIRPTRLSLLLAAAATPFLFLACGGGGSSTASNPAPTSGQVNLTVSDASTEDWAAIGVKILSITLTPQDGGTPVTVYTAPNPVPTTNLVQLDSLSELLNVATVPAGTYTGATLTISANSGDVSLVAAADPEAGFLPAPGSTIPSSQIQIQKVKGTTGSLYVPVNVTFAAPVTIAANQTSPVDLEFNLSHPAFLVEHVPASGAPFWAVSFNGPMVRHNPIHDMTHVILRHTYGTVTGVSTDNTTLSITKDHATWPPVSPETAVTTTNALNILADATNGTLFYNVDAGGAPTTIKDFSSVASVLAAGEFVRVAARYQQDGTLVAVRVWASATFQKVWLSPEGHVLHVDNTVPSAPVITVENESGVGVPMQVDSNTEFYFRTPEKALADATPIATGTAFVNNNNLVRGFKIHASVVDPLATTLVAQTVDIELARYDGYLSAPGATTFTDARTFHTATDDYTITLPYIAAATPNGTDPQTAAAIDGFKWWNFAFPTLVDSGTGAITDFTNATGGAIDFYSAPSQAVSAWGYSGCIFNDPASANTWSARWTILEPVELPLGSVGSAWNASTSSFGMQVPTGVNIVPVTLSTVTGSATLVYQVDKTDGIVTVSPQDLTDAATLASVEQNLSTLGTKVKAYGIPQANGTIMGYVVFYYTGTAPSM